MMGVISMSKVEDKYPFVVRHLLEEEGGGYLIEFPDLPGCMSDGDSIQEAIENGFDAAKCWLAVAKESGRTIPEPGRGAASGKWVQRIPRTMHHRLNNKAKEEGVSLNSLVLSMIAEGLGRRDSSMNNQNSN